MELPGIVRKSATPALFLLALIIFIPGCKTGDLKEQIASLADSQSFLESEKDSLEKVLMITAHKLDTTNAGYQDLRNDMESLAEKNKSLTSGYNARGAELKKAAQANAGISSTLTRQETMNDSLQKVIMALEEKIASIDRQMAESQVEKAALEQEIIEQRGKEIADSVAEQKAANYIPIGAIRDDQKYINITELGGAIGLGDVSVDYSKSLFSITNISGYIINEKFMTGIGLGVNVYNGGVMIPLYLDMRYTFKKSDFTPFIVADGGLLLYFSDLRSSGLFINPAVGLNKSVNRNLGLQLTTGLLIQDTPTGARSSFINFKIGVSFKPN